MVYILRQEEITNDTSKSEMIRKLSSGFYLYFFLGSQILYCTLYVFPQIDPASTINFLRAKVRVLIGGGAGFI